MSSSIKRSKRYHHLLVHNEDTPSNGPLLETDETTSFTRRGQLGDVDRHLCRLDAHRESVDDTASNKHANVLRGTDNGRPNDPTA